MVKAARTAGSSMTFPGQDGGEVVQFYFRQHWLRLVKPFVVMVLWTVFVAAAFVVVVSISPAGQSGFRHILLLILCAFVLLSQFTFLTAFYRHFLLVIVVTDRKIHRIKKTLLLVNDHQRIDVTALQDINKSQRGPIQNIFGFGTLTLEAQGTVVRLHFVPDIARKYSEILQLRTWPQGTTGAPA